MNVTSGVWMITWRCRGGSGEGGWAFRTAHQKDNAWKNKRKYLGPKNLGKPSSLTNAVTIDRSVVCEKFAVALHPRRLTASSLLAHLRVLSKVFLLASISSILWRFNNLQCYSLQIRFSLMGRRQTLQTRNLGKGRNIRTCSVWPFLISRTPRLL